MKKLLLTIVAVTTLLSAHGQKEGLTLIGEESKKVEADMMMNALYLGSLEGLDMWLTKSDEGVKGLANKRDWHVVKLTEGLFPMERVDLPETPRCQVLGAVGAESDASGIHASRSASSSMSSPLPMPSRNSDVGSCGATRKPLHSTSLS